MAVGIVVVLAAVSFVGVYAYQRSMYQLEYDGIAREIFFTAQNHLTMADSQGLVDLNHASREQLMTLPAIGESRADAIVRYREENGPFSCTEDVMNISGIKNSVYEQIKQQITVQ